MIGRVIAAAAAVGVVAFASIAESDTGQLSADRTEAQIVRSFGPGAKASCQDRHGYWDYKCRVRNVGGTVTIEVRVNDDTIVDRSH
jgi:hypothetical protein